MRTNSKSAPVQGLATRFGIVRGYFIDHLKGKHYNPVFSALDPELDKHAEDINSWWNAKQAITEDDEPVIARMERVVELLKNARSLAA